MQFRSRAQQAHSEEHWATIKQLDEQLHQLDSNQLKGLLKKLVPEYTPFLD
jgi:hypothetical protein